MTWLNEATVKTAADLLEEARERKRGEIRAAFAQASIAAISDPLGGAHDWHGGYESATKLANAHLLAMESGLTSVTFYDTENSGHTLSLDDAKTVALAVGGKYQQDFATKQDLMRQIDGATTRAEIDAVSWDTAPS